MDALDELAIANAQRRPMRRPRRHRRVRRWIAFLLLLLASAAAWRYRQTIERELARVHLTPEGKKIVNRFKLAQSPQELFESVSPAVVRIIADGPAKGIGTGFFVSGDGLLVTNYHVVENATGAKVLDGNGAEMTVEGMVAWNPSVDLAILKVNVVACRYIELPSEDEVPKVGTHVYAIGNPLGLTNTLSEGLVSGVRSTPGLRVIQTSAAISPGSSGGPLLTRDGQVVGVTTAYVAFGQNLNFAVSSKHVKDLVDSRGKPAPLPRALGAGREY